MTAVSRLRYAQKVASFEHLGSALHLLRVRNGWTLGEAGEHAGLLSQQISRYEGKTLPQTETLQRLLVGLGCNLVDLHEALTFARYLGVRRLPRGRGAAEELWTQAAQSIWPAAGTGVAGSAVAGTAVSLRRIGPALAHLRLVRGLTVTELGERSGLGKRYVSHLEKSSNLQLRTVGRVLRALDCDLRHLQVALALVEVPEAVLWPTQTPVPVDTPIDVPAQPSRWPPAVQQIREALAADPGPRADTILLRLALLGLGQAQQPAAREAELQRKLEALAAQIES